MSGFISTAALYFGMKKKSTAHTIVAAVILVALTTTNAGDSVDADQFLIRVMVIGMISLLSIILTMKKTLNNLDLTD